MQNQFALADHDSPPKKAGWYFGILNYFFKKNSEKNPNDIITLLKYQQLSVFKRTSPSLNVFALITTFIACPEGTDFRIAVFLLTFIYTIAPGPDCSYLTGLSNCVNRLLHVREDQ